MTRWTDDRLDDLKHQFDELGRRMDQGFALQRQEINARFDQMEARIEARFEKIDDKFFNVGGEIRETQRMVISLHATITRLSVTLLAVVAGLVVTRLA